MKDKVVFKMPMTKAEREYVMGLARADGRTMIAYCRGKVGLSFAIGGHVSTPSMVPISQNAAERLEVKPTMPTIEILDWNKLPSPERRKQQQWAMDAGHGFDKESGHPIDSQGYLILRNTAGSWVKVSCVGRTKGTPDPMYKGNGAS